MKIVIDLQGNKLTWDKGDLHTKFGVIKEKDLKSKKSMVKSHTGKAFLVYPASFMDHIDVMKRGPAVMNEKDVGYILAVTGINSKSVIVDAGTGTGKLVAFLANISGHVTTYEKNDQFYNLSKENLKTLGLKVMCKHKDITEGIDETHVDVLTLDLSNPWDVLPHAEKALKSGGFLVSYLPNINQVKTLLDHAKKHSFYLDHITELLERQWNIDERKMAPQRDGITHTAFLVFLRKL